VKPETVWVACAGADKQASTAERVIKRVFMVDGLVEVCTEVWIVTLKNQA
jgi:hypothetical protein